jgi:hypothetical protein
MKTIKLSAILLMVTLICNAQSAITLKLNLEKNKSYKFKNIISNTVNTSVNGNTQVVETESVSFYSLKAIDLKPDFLVIEFHTDSSSTMSNSGGKESVFNSNLPGDIKSTEINEVMNCILNRMSKNSLFFKVDYFGKVIEIVNYKMYSSIVLKDIDSLKLQSSVANVIKKSISSLVDENTLKLSFLNLVNYIPGNQVSIGNTWNNSYLMSNNGLSFNFENTYKLEKISGDVATISNESNIKPSTNEPVEMYGFKMNFSDISGSAKANQNVNTNTGLLKSSSSKMKMAGNLVIDIPGNPITAPMEVSTESSVDEI